MEHAPWRFHGKINDGFSPALMTPIANQSPGPFESSARASEKRQTS